MSYMKSRMAPSFSLVQVQLPLLAVLAIMCFASSCQATSETHDLLMLGRFHRWMSAHNRSYAGAGEKLRRFQVYRRNMQHIDATNAAGELGYQLGENEFTDLTHEEFMARYTGGSYVEDDTNDDARGSTGTVITTLAGDVHEGHRRRTIEGPDAIDWNAKGYVTPAKNQKGCGACWAFAVVGAIESMVKMNTGRGGKLLNIDLSEQELIDCDSTNLGCTGGRPSKAFQWIQDNGGLLEESEYPYQEHDGQCRTDKSAIRKGKITGFEFVQKDEESLREAVYSKGPIVAGIDSHDPNLWQYKTGIYNYKGPCGAKLDHSVLVVGYGTNQAGQKYWVVKNSWGQTWGQNGFFLMSRGENGKTGLCGITKQAVYPIPSFW